jgi:hypothetical protein
MNEATSKIHEGWAEYGEVYCEACEGPIDLSDAGEFEDALKIAKAHHRENH